MSKYRKGFYGILLLTLTMLFGMTAQAKTDDTIKTGIYAGDVELSGMTAQEATAVIEEHIESLKDVEITLLAANDHDVTTTAGDLGVTWKNPELVQEALELGTHGNVIERYKILMDLQHENYVYPIELDFDLQAINDLLTRCTKYDQEAINVSLKRDGGKFTVVEGQTGYVLDVEKSIDAVYDYLTEEWNHEACSIPLEIVVDEPKGSAEELAQVTDVLGSFTTSYKTSGSSRSANVANGCSLINGTTLYPGEEFSTYKTVSPFSVANGYYMAGSYVSGKVVDSLGGGICRCGVLLHHGTRVYIGVHLQRAVLHGKIGVGDIHHQITGTGTVAAVLHRNADGDLRIICREIGDHHGVQVVLARSVGLAALGGTGLAGDGNGIAGDLAADGAGHQCHALPHQRKGVAVALDDIHHLRLGLAEHLAGVGIQNGLDKMGAVAHAVVGQRGGVGSQLDGAYHRVALPDGGLNIQR